ncbi:toll/interleukin-1 receptor domain-containing protein [Mariniflexile sp. AS56]|uniref:toll/interleukin-1 receptor domain-containing protein n=1 Tax=Mariniflexile sp. AS56 TaxID=3063957 RepID=UPI0026EBC125|nr:toll/interleukin-1 receptor domain-containing protein [Mariniflexile sp. AS56]MDO7172619.1 toll/interleukin-1 receptor domain-containing protein [Mariniflexile sp. AS56]
MFKKLKDRTNRIRGNDIFISYSRADSLDYALTMANKLSTRQYFCYLDQYHNHPGEKIPKALLDALKSCSAMVIILSPKAFLSQAMFQEIIEFKKTGRLIIPIKIDNIENLGQYEDVLKGLAITIESTNIWKNSEPSKKIINRIIGSFTYRKRIKVLRNLAIATMILIAAGILVGSTYSYLLKKDIDNLQVDQKLLINEKTSLEFQNTGLSDSISIKNNLLFQRNYKITELDSSIVNLNKELKISTLVLKKLNDSAQALYASNLIGLLKNEELLSNNIKSNNFDPFNINLRMLLAIESYKINQNKDAEIILNNSLSFLGVQKFKRIFDQKVVDMSMSPISFSENYFSIILENGDIYLSEANKTFKLKKLINAPQASKIFFINSDELLIVQNLPNQTKIIRYNHKSKLKNSFVLPIRCKKLDFDEGMSLLYIMDFNGKLLCYDWKQKKEVFIETELSDFAINKTQTGLTTGSPIETNEIALWKGDSILFFDLNPNIGKEKGNVFLPYDLFSSMHYSSGGNFVVNGSDLAGLSLGGSINKMYFNKPFNFRFSKENEQTFTYNYGIGNVGFGLLDSEIYFSSEIGGPNVIHFMQMYTYTAQVKEIFRILSPTEIIKLYFNSFDRVLFGIDINGHLIGWDVSKIWKNESKLEYLKGDFLIDEVCKRLLSNLTKENWNHYIKDKPYCKTCRELSS